MMMDIPQAAVQEVDEESDEDILGFWRSGEDDDEDDDEYDSDESSEDDHPEADDEDDDEDEDDFNLIGHR
jgi:hypothetical protein